MEGHYVAISEEGLTNLADEEQDGSPVLGRSWHVRMHFDGGQHYHVDVFSGPDQDHRELLGHLVMDAMQWLTFRSAMRIVLNAETSDR